MSRRAVALLVAIGLLAACGGGSDDTDDAGTTDVPAGAERVVVLDPAVARRT